MVCGEVRKERAIGGRSGDHARVAAHKALRTITAVADDELGDALPVWIAAAVERGPTLVAVIMSRQGHIHAILRQQRPHLGLARRIALRTDGVARMVKVDQRAREGVSLQVVLQPLVLRCRRRDLVVRFGQVERDKVPAARAVAVVVRNIVPIEESPAAPGVRYSWLPTVGLVMSRSRP